VNNELSGLLGESAFIGCSTRVDTLISDVDVSSAPTYTQGLMTSSLTEYNDSFFVTITYGSIIKTQAKKCDLSLRLKECKLSA